MPTGSANNDGASRNDGRDALDLALGKALQRPRWQQASSPAASPDPDAPPDEILLQYVDGALDRDAHVALEHRLLADPATRGRVALLRRALAEPQDLAPAACSRYLFSFAKGKLQFLRGPSEPLPPASAPPNKNEIGFQLPNGGQAELHLRASAEGVELSLLRLEGRAELRRDGAKLPPDGDGRFCRLPPARYELHVCLGADALPPVVLDIRRA